MRGRPGVVVSVGPYQTERWDRPATLGTLRRIPIQLRYPGKQIHAILWLSRTDTGWWIVRVT
jgi:hypothetical protein